MLANYCIVVFRISRYVIRVKYRDSFVQPSCPSTNVMTWRELMTPLTNLPRNVSNRFGLPVWIKRDLMEIFRS